MYSLNEPVSSVLNQKKTPKLIENLLEISQKKFQKFGRKNWERARLITGTGKLGSSKSGFKYTVHDV